MSTAAGRSWPRIRQGVAGDAGPAAEVHCSSALIAYADIFPATAAKPTPESLTPGWATLLGSPDASVLVAEPADDSGELVGTVALVSDPEPDTDLLLSRLYVRPDWWGSGLGSDLHWSAIAASRELGAGRLALWVLEANERARAMYERWGWSLVPGRTFANEPPTIVDVRYQLDLNRPC
ncbi:MAG: GNAT family N-acetyltransferase [Actinomycetia bacterium]|nr:GNAT family N-acetyltransferase [Actinomycetes bacterium]